MGNQGGRMFKGMDHSTFAVLLVKAGLMSLWEIVMGGVQIDLHRGTLHPSDSIRSPLNVRQHLMCRGRVGSIRCALRALRKHGKANTSRILMRP